MTEPTPLPSLEALGREFRRIETSADRPRRKRKRARLTAIAIAVLAVASPAVAAVSGVWDLFAGTTGPNPAPSTTPGAPDSATLSLLGVLRRPTSDADVSPRALAAARSLGGNLAGDLALRYERRLPDAGTDEAYLVPVGRFGETSGSSGPAPQQVIVQCGGCTGDPETGAPPRPAELPANPGACVVLVRAGHERSVGCATASAIKRAGLRVVDGDILVGVVPDGVAEVEVTDGAGTTRRSRVSGNAVSFAGMASADGPSELAALPKTVRWIRSDGTVVSVAVP